jgi:flagellar motor switch protein FliM
MPDAEKILSQHEVDALLSAIDSGAGEPKSSASATPYDFKRPARVPHGHMRSLQSLHEGFARHLQSALSALLRTTIEVKVAAVHQIPLAEFMESLPRPTALAVLAAEPFEGNFLLEVNPTIACPMIERLLGSGKFGAWQQDKALSALEWTVMDAVMGRALELLKETWSPVAASAFRVVRRESDPGRIQLQNPNEASVSVVFEIVMGDQRGSLNLAFPVMAIEGHWDRLGTPAAIAARKKDPVPGQESIISRRLAPAEVQITAELQGERMRIRDLETLRPGDVIVTAHPQTAPVLVSVEGHVKYQGKLGSLKDRKAVKILGAGRDSGAAPPRGTLEVLRGEAPFEPGAPETPEPGLVENLLRLPLELSVVLAEKPLRVRELLSLRPGDILEFSRRADDPLELRAARRPLAHGQAVRIGEKFGFRVTSVRDPRDRVLALGP